MIIEDVWNDVLKENWKTLLYSRKILKDMAKTLERRSAKLLAFVLALIMIGSVAVIAFRGSTYIPKREVKYEFRDVLDVISKLPDKPDVVYYLDFTGNRIASSIAKAYAKNLFQNKVFNYVRLVSFNSTIVAFYYNTGSFLYLFDTDKRVFASYDKKEEIDGFDVKVKEFYGVVDEINPVVIGTMDKVYELIKNIRSGSDEDEFVTKIPRRDYFFIRIFRGDVLNSIIKLNQSNESIADFYFEGYSMNGSRYEKVVAMNFTKNVFFIESNKTEEYYFKNYGGFSVAIMIDSNFTKLLTSSPEMRSIIIKGL